MHWYGLPIGWRQTRPGSGIGPRPVVVSVSSYHDELDRRRRNR